MMCDKEELERLKKLAATNIEKPEWQLEQNKKVLKIVDFRITKHKVLLEKIAKGSWKMKEIGPDQLSALTSHDIKLLNQYKSECESNILKLEDQVETSSTSKKS